MSKPTLKPPNIVRESKKIKYALEVAELLAQNVSHSEITLTLFKAGYNRAKDREEIVAAARLILRNNQAKEVAEHYEQSLSSLEDLYAKCYAIQDFSECRQIIAQKNDLFLMYVNTLESLDDD